MGMDKRVAEALRLGIENAKHFSIAIDTVVIFPEEENAAQLKAVDGQTATIAWPDGRTRDVPLDQVASARVVQHFLALLRVRSAERLDPTRSPEDQEGVMVVSLG